MLNSSSDEEDAYLGTKSLCNLQAKFGSFYQTKKLDQSDDEDEPLSTRPWTPFNNMKPSTVEAVKAKTSPVGTTRTTRPNKEVSNNNAILILSDDESICDHIPSTSSANSCDLITSQSKTETSAVIDVDLIEAPGTSRNTNDVLQQLDELAEIAKELSEDYDAALYGKTRSKSKRRKTSEVTAVVLNTRGGKKLSRATRKSTRLQHLQHQIAKSSSHNCFSSRSTQQCAPIELDSDSDDNNSINTCKKPIEIAKVNANPKVQCNINWRCDSEITHRIYVFKFQCLSCIEDFCCEEYSIDHRLILFTIDDKPVALNEHCYASLKLSESVVIDAGVLPESYLHIERPKVAKALGLIRFQVQYVENAKTKIFPVHARKDDCCAIIFWLIIKQLRCDMEEILLKYDGSLVTVTDTIDSLDLEEDDCLDLTLTCSEQNSV